MWWKAVAREPLVHFLLIGAALFAIAGGHEPVPPPEPVASEPQPAASEIVIDANRKQSLVAAAEKRVGRAPTAAEIEDEIERWIDEEVLFREAVARGLDRDDPIVHERIASRMSYVLQQSLSVPEPTEAQLRAWFDEHRDQWAKPERIDFTHVFIADETRAPKIEAALAAGAPPETLGDRFSGGHRYRGRKLADVGETFGAEFVSGLASQPVGSWQRRRSKHGLHFVRVEKVSAASDADFAAARLDIRKSWLDEQRGRALAAEIKRLRGRWQIKR